jgi:nucleoid DNA-binding protein
MHEKFRYAQLVDLVAQESGTSKQLVHNLFIELVKEIKADLQREGRVHLAGLGRFRLVWSEERQGRNPQTGEAITIPAHNRILFKPDAPIRRMINREYEGLKSTPIEEKKVSTLTEELKAAATVASEPQKPPVQPEPVKEPIPVKPVPEKPSAAPSFAAQKLDSPEPAKQTEFLKPTEEKPAEPPVEKPEQQAVKPEPGEEAEPPKPAVKPPAVAKVPPPVTVKVIREEQLPAVPTPPPEQEKEKRKIPLWLWSIPVLLVILLIILFWPSGEESQPLVVEKPAAETAVPQPSEEPQAETPPAPAQPASGERAGTPGGTHLVETGDNLWGISTAFYKDAYLWPNILRVNLATVRNPDFLKQGLQIEVPGLQGKNGKWTTYDLEQIAEGYIHAYLLYHERDKMNAIHYLWVARNANEAVYNEFRDRINEADRLATLSIKGRSRY